jgi:hypothetical protein
MRLTRLLFVLVLFVLVLSVPLIFTGCKGQAFRFTCRPVPTTNLATS